MCPKQQEQQVPFVFCLFLFSLYFRENAIFNQLQFLETDVQLSSFNLNGSTYFIFSTISKDLKS